MKKLYKMASNKYLNYLIWLGLVMISFFNVDYVFRYASTQKILYFSVLSKYANSFTLSWILIFSIIFILLNKKIGKKLYIVLITIFQIYTFAQLIHLNLLDRFFGIYDLFSVGEGIGYFLSLIVHANLYSFLSIILNIILGYLTLKFWPEERPTNRVLFTISFTLLCLSLGLRFDCLSWLNIEETTDSWNSNQEASKVYNRYNNPTSSVQISGTYEFIYRDLKLFFFRDKDLTETEVAEISNFLESRNLTKENDYTGIFKDKNVIMIMLESVDYTFFNKDVMPTLFSLKDKSLYFENRYSPIFGIGATFNSEFTSLTGNYSSTDGIAAYFYTQNDFKYSLPNMFKEEGYCVNSFHMNRPTFYERVNMHQQMGFEKYNSFYDYAGKFVDVDSEILDYDNIYHDIVKDEKFFSFIITYSAHLPYDSSNRTCREYMQDKFYDKDDYETSCFKSALYDTDLFIKKLIEKLEADNKLNDTVIILYGDHLAYAYNKRVLMGGNEIYDLNKGIYMIYNPKLAGKKINTLNTTIDMTPTIANLFALEQYNPNNYLGVDVFNKKANHLAYFADYNWYDGKIYSADLQDGIYRANKKYINDNNSYVEKLIDYNNKMVAGNYYKYH